MERHTGDPPVAVGQRGEEVDRERRVLVVRRERLVGFVAVAAVRAWWIAVIPDTLRYRVLWARTRTFSYENPQSNQI